MDKAQAVSASVPSLVLAENNEGAQFDTLARRRVRGRGRIDKRRMRSETRHSAVIARIEAFDEQDFVRAHCWRIEPALGRIVDEIVSLAAPIAIDEIGGDEVLRRDAARVADR